MLYSGTRYLKTYVHLRHGDTSMLGIRNRFTFDLTNATYYVWTESDTIDGLAYRMYGNSALYWAILDTNPKYSCELDIKKGDTLVIPTLSEVLRVIE